MSKAIITVVGKDTVGIIAKVCTYLAGNQINILDISQTIVQGYFNMMMIVDVSSMTKSFGQVSEELEQAGDGLRSSARISSSRCTESNTAPREKGISGHD